MHDNADYTAEVAEATGMLMYWNLSTSESTNHSHLHATNTQILLLQAVNTVYC